MTWRISVLPSWPEGLTSWWLAAEISCGSRSANTVPHFWTMSSNSDVKTPATLPIPAYTISDARYGRACLAVGSPHILRGAPTLGTSVRWRQRPAFSHPPTPFGCPSPLRGLEAATSPSREHACEIPSGLLCRPECIPRFTKGESHSQFGDPATLAPPLAALASPKSAGGSSD
ncbi:hypothetical protein RhiJN_27721 [Ceratobasidium sp. AG-Ba]|nr:hypothetical protein RhiJN_27721 [Ceratobasidium sp. AG-Ba]